MNTMHFAALFSGRKDAYGLGRGAVVRETLTLHDYDRHLQGLDSGIGVFPLSDEGTVRFAAIDSDRPDFDLAASLQLLVPGRSFVERSRSGNAHVWVFFDEPTPAWAVRAVLRNATEAVGHPEIELFPKQDSLREGGVGNYINLPYHGEERPILHHDGSRRELGAFIEDASSSRQDPSAWIRRARALGGQPPEEREATSEWGESPNLHECAQYILERKDENPLVPGHRAQVLFHVSCQLLNWREIDEETARELVHGLNRAGTNPAPEQEVNRQFDNARDGRFTSTGCDDPTMAPYVHPDCPIAAGKAGR